jgi:hypothetical protein
VVAALRAMASLEDLFGDDALDDTTGLFGGGGAAGEFDGSPRAPGAARGSDEDGVEEKVDGAAGGAAPRARVKVAETLHVPPVLETRQVHGQRVSVVRLPKIVTVATEPFDEATYDGDAEARALAAIGKPVAQDAAIRWRRVPAEEGGGGGADSGGGGGDVPLQSNAKIVEWSNGSLTLHIGEEVFSLYTKSAGAGRGAARSGASGSSGPAAETLHLYQRGTADVTPGAGPVAPSQARTEAVLQAEVVVSDRLVVQALHTTVAELSVFDARAGTAGLNVEETPTGAARSGHRPKRARLEYISVGADNAEDDAPGGAAASADAAADTAGGGQKGDKSRRKAGGNKLKAAAREAAAAAAGGAGGGGDDDDEAVEFSGNSVKALRKAVRRGAGSKRRRPFDEDEGEGEGQGEADDLDGFIEKDDEASARKPARKAGGGGGGSDSDSDSSSTTTTSGSSSTSSGSSSGSSSSS